MALMPHVRRQLAKMESERAVDSRVLAYTKIHGRDLKKLYRIKDVEEEEEEEDGVVKALEKVLRDRIGEKKWFYSLDLIGLVRKLHPEMNE